MKNFFKATLLLVAIIAWVTYAVIQVSTTTDFVFVIILGYIGVIVAGVGIGVFIMWLFDWRD